VVHEDLMAKRATRRWSQKSKSESAESDEMVVSICLDRSGLAVALGDYPP
jgi:hypothetical protein